MKKALASSHHPPKSPRIAGFTLIELAIVLVIIGLIVGGVLVGRDLVSAAGERAQITQIEKYNTAANTFREKYGYLPGDIPAGPAAQFGFATRGTTQGEGDGNGILEGASGNAHIFSFGEPVMFWADLSVARMIDGSFTGATSTGPAPALTPNQFAQYFPPAKVGYGNYVMIIPVDSALLDMIPGKSYYGIVDITGTNSGNSNQVQFTAGMTVKQAYAMDTKLDDGLPQSGVVVDYLSRNGQLAGSPTTCEDNNNVQYATLHYSITQNGGAGVNCMLLFMMRAGD